MELLNSVIKAVEGFGSSQFLVSLIVGLEFAFRMIKSDKPLSIMYLISDGLKKVGELCQKLGQLLDKVLPQRLK